jgi:hypothetical protein
MTAMKFKSHRYWYWYYSDPAPLAEALRSN